jgi:hypothetical protein
LFFNSIEIDVERGIGLGKPSSETQQGIDPQAMLQWSDDGGFTWSNESWMSYGRIGEYKARLRWTRLGMSRDRLFRIIVSDPNKCVMIAANANIEKKDML